MPVIKIGDCMISLDGIQAVSKDDCGFICVTMVGQTLQLQDDSLFDTLYKLWTLRGHIIDIEDIKNNEVGFNTLIQYSITKNGKHPFIKMLMNPEASIKESENELAKSKGQMTMDFDNLNFSGSRQ